MLQHHFDKIFIWIRDIELVVRGNQIDIMLVTVEKRTYARLGAIAVLVFRCLMIYILSLPLVIRLSLFLCHVTAP